MLITLGFYPGDYDQALRLADWIAELGVGAGHRLLVARDIRANSNPFMDAGFDRVDEIVISNDVWNKWAESANNVFRQIVTYIELEDKAPYHLWIENDVVPLTADAFSVLEAEYLAAGKPFMGDLVNVDNVPIHMSGIGIYPGLLTHHAGQAKLAVETAWDVFAADQIVPRMHETGRISHAWKHPTFEDWAAVEREVFAIKPECVLFHASKDGSLIRLLREKRNPKAISEEYIEAIKEPSPSFSTEAIDRLMPSAPVEPPLPILCDILIKSHPPDYPLLKYCLHSLWKFASGFQNVVLVCPEGEWPNMVNKTQEMPENLKVQLVPEKPENNGYLFQQTIKASAHQFTVSDYVMHIDSDTILTTAVTPNSFLRDGKPLWMVTPYGATHSPWKASTEAFIGHPVHLEFMRRLPMFIPRKVHEKADEFCMEKHGVSLGEYIMGRAEFSEFNILGAVAFDFFYSEISWYDTTQSAEADWPPLVALQTWSHAPIEEAQEKFEKVLGTPWQHQEYWRKRREAENKCVHPEWDICTGPEGDPRIGKTICMECGELSGVEIERPAEPEPSSFPSNGEGEPPSRVDSYPDIEHPRQTATFEHRKIVIPWQNKLESELEIKRLVAELKKFQTSPAYVNRVRMELKLAVVIPGKKAIKRMKVRRRRLGGVPA